MPKIRIDVNKLENATADYISLVSRGANRIPFRIIKQHPDEENSMIDIGGKLDLADIRNVLKSDGKPKPAASAPKPVLAAIVIEKGDYLTDEVKAELTAAGIDMSQPTENEDDTISFIQGQGASPDDTVVMKMSDSTLAIYANLDGEKIVKGTPFEDMYDEAGFLLSPKLASESLLAVIKKTEEDSTLDATAKAKAVTDESAANAEYTGRLAEVVTDSVTKADEIVTKACGAKRKQKADAQAALDTAAATQKAEGDLVDCPACDGAKCNVCDSGKVTKAEAESISKAFPFKKKKPAAAAADGAPGDKMPPKEAPCAKAEGSQEGAAAATITGMNAADLQAALATALAPVTKSLTDLVTEIATVKKAQEEQAAELTGVKEVVAKADKILKGTLIGGAPAADREAVVVEKAEGELGNLDTAYMPTARRVQKSFGARQQDLQRITRR